MYENSREDNKKCKCHATGINTLFKLNNEYTYLYIPEDESQEDDMKNLIRDKNTSLLQ
jgi:hypothetical protein